MVNEDFNVIMLGEVEDGFTEAIVAISYNPSYVDVAQISETSIISSISSNNIILHLHHNNFFAGYKTMPGSIDIIYG